MQGVHAPAYWSVVIPVKPVQVAKSRLEVASPADRVAVALALALDTIDAVCACRAVADVIVVTNDVDAGSHARDLGAVVVPDEPEAGLNAALEHGAAVARERRPDCGVAAIAADLPSLRPQELADALTLAEQVPRAAVADADGDGTVLLTARAGETLAPAYGAGSLGRHVQSGAVALDVDVPGLRRDVDTVADLQEARRLGCGPRTAAVVEKVLPN